MPVLTWLATIVVLLTLILASLWLLLYQLIKQQGRLLLRLDRVEGSIASGGVFATQIAASARPARPPGLSAGEPAPDFELADLEGRVFRLKDFFGKRTLAVNWSPNCGYCHQIAAELASLQDNLQQRGVQLLLISYGDAASNRKLAEEQGFKCPLLLHKPESASIRLFEHFGTPVAYLLDETGKVAEPVAIGADGVPAVARRLAGGERGAKRLPGQRPLAESQINRTGLKPGTRAPNFSLPTIAGCNVSLDEFRGRRVLLVFSDPHCGPCEQLAPMLARFADEAKPGSPAVLVISRGEMEENRRKAEIHGFTFPVALQRKWEISKEYGTFATPAAFLIDEKGIVDAEMAIGPDAILELGTQAGVRTENEVELSKAL